MTLVDSHCHLHDAEYGFDVDAVLAQSKKAGVTKIITAGTSVADSKAALEFAGKHDGVYATIGIHPGIETEENVDDLETLILSKNKKLIGFGDIGLDYHYQPVDKERQKELLKKQLELAVKYDLPVQFHVREAFDDFWPIFDSFKGLRGVLHCYTDNEANLKKALKRGLYISVNGIVTFNKNPELEKAYNQIPLDRLLLETDAPYLTPSAFRAKLNIPAYVVEVAKKWADRCGCELTEVCKVTTGNATSLFSLR